ncbi:TetR/AcrR family transcriptional regulator [Paenibacillus illinoisensis]|uniref:TetR/AcrR family transcriptional regulator n=1 Tax=Paenibacillus TaxID=44249 RepID=UPI001C8DE199|nr:MULTISPECIES: TetR/AcrR family transcriptional regulator [Paenibacillus]MBY0216116.1 TetR family transcriptional regulator [Paenibacillus illinoisensis]MCM3204053.1 TetR/AcrR family transcriptional regulator [Paenibacillus illinoisensis]WJH31285.1 TetR/AcrR family transcriptional regulator [Paenibacillus sp. CC-CFT742]
MNKKQLQTEQTKKKLADASRALFVQKGYKATSIEDIVAATGSSKGNIYYHFKSKEGLFLYLIDEWDREWEENWASKEHLYKTSTEKIHGLMEQLVLDDMNHPLTKAADEFFTGEKKENDIEERIALMFERHIQFNRQLVQQGIENGEFKEDNVDHLALILESAIIGLSQLSRGMKSEEAVALYRQAANVFLHGISISKA